MAVKNRITTTALCSAALLASAPAAAVTDFIAVPYYPPPEGVNVGIGLELRNGEELSGGPFVSYGQDLYSTDKWSSRYEIEAYAPIVIYNLRSGQYRNAIGDLILRAEFLADPFGYGPPELPVFHPSGKLGIELNLPKDGDAELDYFGELDLLNLGGPMFKLTLPALKFRYNVGDGFKYSTLYQSLELFASPLGCSAGAAPDSFDCTFTRAEVVFGGSGVPEPAQWTLLITGFAFTGGAMRARRGKRHGMAA